MRVALAPEVDRAAIDALALAQGWRLASIFARPRRVVFVSATSTELVTWHEEERCLDIDGHDPEALAEAVRAALELDGLGPVRVRERLALPLLGVNAPGLVLECATLTSPLDRARVTSPEGLRALAASLATAVAEYQRNE